MSTLDLALLYADLELSVFPLPCGSKVPAKGFKWTEFRERRADRNELRKWFGGEERNIGIVTGDVSGGLVVRDFDEEGAYERWRDSHPDTAETLPTVKTARGFHVYARGQADKTKYYTDGELRAGGTYVLTPSSLHPSGVTYAWTSPFRGDEIPEVDLAAVGWLENAPCNTESAGHSVLAVCAALSVSSVLHAAIDQAIQRTIPPGPGHRERKLFELARELKAFPELADMSVNQFKPVVQAWHKVALSYIRTKSFTESWFAFQRAWSKVKFPKGNDPISHAYAQAVASDVPPGCDYDIEGVVDLAKLCRQLQAMAGEKPFFLDCRTAAGLLDVDSTTAWRWLRGLADDGHIEVVSSGSLVKRKANEYRWRG
ncbi:MAG: bifunctional DNA primase/polymerase [Pirellulaceae bacterium]